MVRTREWMKFGALVIVTFVIAATFAGAVDLPKRSPTEQQAAVLEVLEADRPAPLSAAVQPAASLGEAFVEVADLAKAAVVFIRAESVSDSGGGGSVPRGLEDFFPQQRGGPRIRQGSGSGFIISADGYILTNNHVVEQATTLTVRLYDKREFEATVVGRDPATDVAVIKINATDLPTTTLGNSDSVKVGEWVLAVGNPMGEQFSFTVTAGIVSAKSRNLVNLPINSDYRILDFIQTDAAINPGNSGGPLVNIHGQVVGINAAIASTNGSYQGYGFAIPVNLARIVANQLIANGRVTRAILGVSIGEVTPEDAEYVGLQEIRGVLVRDYSMPDSPAEQAGIRPGDVIVELDGEEVEYVAQLQQIVGFKRPGESVRVTVYRRGGVRDDITVRLAEAPTGETRVAAANPEPEGNEPAHTTRLGIAVQELTEEMATRSRQIGAEHAGLRVMEVDIDSPARSPRGVCPAANRQQCGFGDIITHVDGERVQTLEEFDEAVRAVEEGGLVSLRVFNPTLPARQRIVRVRVR